MDTSISEYIKELNNFNSYYQQCKYIHRNIYSIKPEDIKKILFFKMVQIIFNDLQHIAFIINEGFIVDKVKYRYDLSKSFPIEKNIFDGYIKLDKAACINIRYQKQSNHTIRLDIPFDEEKISATVDLTELFKCSNAGLKINV